MSTLALTYTLVPNTPENVSHVQQNFVDIRTWANGNISSANITDGGIATADLADLSVTAGKVAANTLTDAQFAASAGMYSAYRHIAQMQAAGTATVVSGAGVYFTAPGSALQVSTAEVPTPWLVDLTAADYAVSGRTPKLRVKAQVFTESTTALGAVTLTVGLYPMTATAGTEYKMLPGTVISGSTVPFASPAATANLRGDSGDFTFPADAFYAIGVASSGALTANSTFYVSAQLQLHWV